MAGSRDATPRTAAAAAYLLQVAKDWTSSCFAAAECCEFTLPAHRFELSGATVRRHALPARSAEATCPLGNSPRSQKPVAWSHRVMVTLLIDHESGTTAVEQEMAEVIAVEGDVILVQAAAVIRVPELGVCLGPFRSPR
jgi:HEPN domain-containing protein